MKRFVRIESRVVMLPADNIDTDQIIPARFLKTVSKEGLGGRLFYDWRYDTQGHPRLDFVLNRPESAGAEILLAGDNFGCGSSREHAPWALSQFGFRSIVSTSFADIFRQNALKNGLLPVVIPKGIHSEFVSMLTSNPGATVVIDLATETVLLPGGRTVGFAVDSFSRQCLLEGVDEVGYILNRESDISAFEKSREIR